MKPNASCGTGFCHTGANDWRCSGVGPYSRSAARCFGVLYPLCEARPYSGKTAIPLAHHAVAFDLGQNRRGCNRGRKRVAVNDGLLRHLAIEAHGIDQQMIGCGSRRITASRMATRDA